jgi:hypothetical protein
LNGILNEQRAEKHCFSLSALFLFFFSLSLCFYFFFFSFFARSVFLPSFFSSLSALFLFPFFFSLSLCFCFYFFSRSRSVSVSSFLLVQNSKLHPSVLCFSFLGLIVSYRFRHPVTFGLNSVFGDSFTFQIGLYRFCSAL